MNTSDIEIVADLSGDKGNKYLQNKISRTSKISAHFSLHWQSDYATHIDSRFIDNLNVWRDYFPAEIEMQLDGCSAGSTISHSFGSGEALNGFSKANIHTVKQATVAFNN